jgi:SAM-dependent methyltransferase
MSLRVPGWLEGGPSEAVIGILERLQGTGLRTLLDIPSGGAPVRARAEALGFRVFEADLLPRKRMCGVVADACAPLPFRTGALDCVLSMEGLEHFENQTGFLRECARVLAPGGAFILTTPNMLHLSARLAQLLTGQRSLRQGFVNETSTLRSARGARLYHGHAYLIDAFRLRYLLRVVGLEVERVQAANLSLASVLFAPLVAVIWLATRYSLWAGRRRLARLGRRVPAPEVESALRRLALSPALLFGKKMVVVARKPRAPVDSD